ncbi:MAG: hypothetical protein K2N23_06315, partial [Clostridia bacterium]|nr:hypothetical protein [Clostridia bacterium]
MTLLKYLGKCIIEFIYMFDAGGGNPSASWKKILVGFIASAVIITAIVLQVIYLDVNWYFSIFIALCEIIAFCLATI